MPGYESHLSVGHTIQIKTDPTRPTLKMITSHPAEDQARVSLTSDEPDFRIDHKSGNIPSPTSMDGTLRLGQIYPDINARISWGQNQTSLPGLILQFSPPLKDIWRSAILFIQNTSDRLDLGKEGIPQTRVRTKYTQADGRSIGSLACNNPPRLAYTHSPQPDQPTIGIFGETQSLEFCVYPSPIKCEQLGLKGPIAPNLALRMYPTTQGLKLHLTAWQGMSMQQLDVPLGDPKSESKINPFLQKHEPNLSAAFTWGDNNCRITLRRQTAGAHELYSLSWGPTSPDPNNSTSVLQPITHLHLCPDGTMSLRWGCSAVGWHMTHHSQLTPQSVSQSVP